MSKYTKTARSICDVLLFVALCVSIHLVQRVFRGNKRGFFCGDDSLAYPLRDGTIGLAVLLSTTLAVPGLVIVIVELFKQLPQGHGHGGKANACAEKNASGCSCGCRIGHRLLQCYKQLGYFLFGLALTLFTTQLSKHFIGRLRPHFYAVCQPMLADGSTCADAHNQGQYFDSYHCANPNATAFLINQLHQSFPSGHASLSFYAMSYLAIYLQAVLSTRLSKLLKHLLQFIFLMFAWYVALTRITDYWHHWTDVLAGMTLGVLFALLVAVYVTDLFAFKRYSRGGNVAGGGSANGAKVKPQQVSPKHVSAKSNSTLVANVAAAAAPPTLPAYTFGTLPYLPHPAQAQYAQTYHNYGYVP